MNDPCQALSQANLEVLLFNTSCSLAKLQTLSLDFADFDIQADHWKKWQELEAKKPLLSLKHLNLTFKKCAFVSENFLEALGTGIAFYLSNLESVNLSIYESKTTDEGIIVLGERISESLRNLKAFTAQINNSIRNVKSALEKMFDFVPNLQVKLDPFWMGGKISGNFP